MTKKIVQTAGREQLGHFAPEFAHFNDDVLFGENWNNTDIDLKTRCIITVVALMSQGITDNALLYHLKNAKAHGVSQKEFAAIVTHVAFYAGWPKAWAVFNLGKQIWTEQEVSSLDKEAFAESMAFPLGEPNTAYAQYFTGQSYLASLAHGDCSASNVSFEPGCRNHWHIHHGQKQLLLCVAGKGWYQEWGKPAQMMVAGDVIDIPAEIKHWHGAAKDSWFAHIAIMVSKEGANTEWCEPVSEEHYLAVHQA